MSKASDSTPNQANTTQTSSKIKVSCSGAKGENDKSTDTRENDKTVSDGVSDKKKRLMIAFLMKKGMLITLVMKEIWARKQLIMRKIKILTL